LYEEDKIESITYILKRMSFLFCFLIFFVVVALSFGVLSHCQSIPEWTNGGYSCDYGSPQLAEQDKSNEGLSAVLQRTSESDTLEAPENQEEEVPILMEEPATIEEIIDEPPQTASVEETPVLEESPAAAPVEETPEESPAAAPVEETPEESPAAAPVEETPEESPAETPVEETPALEESPAETPVEETPASEESPAETPVEESTSDAPTEENPVLEESAGTEPTPSVGAQEQVKPTKAKASKTSRTVKPKKKTTA
jgi:hypothetical protein